MLKAFFTSTLPHLRFQQLQKRLAYEVSGEPGSGALILCDHPPSVAIGREGSREHVRSQYPDTCFVPRGGGTMLHLPGQIVCAPILSLVSLGLTPAQYRDAFQSVVLEVIHEFTTDARMESRPGIWVRDRMLAHMGIAIRSGITCFGMTLNATVDLDPFRDVHVDGVSAPMTSLARESPFRVRLAAIRRKLAGATAKRFGFDGFDIQLGSHVAEVLHSGVLG